MSPALWLLILVIISLFALAESFHRRWFRETARPRSASDTPALSVPPRPAGPRNPDQEASDYLRKVVG